jgi:hypothetical protein
MNGPVKKFDVAEEARLIPAWSIVLGIVIFIGIQLVWYVYIPLHRPPGRPVPPLALRIFASLVLGVVFLIWSMLVGYVNRDSGRRGMNRTLWTIIAIFVGNGIGFILYFLLRDPLPVICPGCGAAAAPSSTFCSKCRYALRPTCPKCGQAFNPGDQYCAHCGAEVRNTAT